MVLEYGTAHNTVDARSQVMWVEEVSVLKGERSVLKLQLTLLSTARAGH